MLVQLGSHDRAPIVEAPHGEHTWCGKLTSELTESMLLTMTAYIQYEARRRGYSDSAERSIGRFKQVFHEDFLGGWAHRLWVEAYEQGVHDEKLGPLMSEYKLRNCGR